MNVVGLHNADENKEIKFEHFIIRRRERNTQQIIRLHTAHPFLANTKTTFIIGIVMPINFKLNIKKTVRKINSVE